MPKLSHLALFLIGVVLVALMIVSRSYHVPAIANVLPSASWAIFFIAGVYLRPTWVPVALLALAAVIDFTAVRVGGVDAFCVSPAYVALVPAYGALWFAGRWYAQRYRFELATLLPLCGAALVGTLACELISSGSFYLFSGRFTDLSFVEFGRRFALYSPHSLISMAFWVAFTAVTHALILSLHRVGADVSTN
jgi:hypothetical protein